MIEKEESTWPRILLSGEKRGKNDKGKDAFAHACWVKRSYRFTSSQSLKKREKKEEGEKGTFSLGRMA